MKLRVKILFILPIVGISIITIYNALDQDIPKALGFLSVELAVISILFATLSIEISNKSDEKMTALTNLNFDEKITMFGKYKTAINSRKTILEQIKQKEKNQKPLTKKEKALTEAITKEIQEYLEQFKDDLQAVSNLISYLDDLQKRNVITKYISPILEDTTNFANVNLLNEIKELEKIFE